MSSSHRFLARLSWLALSVGCASGAASGTSAPNPTDAGATSDAARNDGGSLATETPDAEVDEDAGDEDASTSDSGNGTDAGADASSDSSGTDATSGTDAASDAASDAGADAPIDSAVFDAAPDAGPDASGVACTIDDGTWVTPLTQYDLAAKGKLWSIDADGTLIGSIPLASIPGLAQGPCAGQQGVCKLDATTWRDDLGQYHIVSGGKLWRVELDGDLIGSTTLTDFSGIAAGPCLNKTGASCTFEAGAWRSDLGQYHLVSDGKIWAIDGTNGSLIGSSTLTSIAGVAAGPCAGQVGTCHVDAFTFRPDTSEIHVIAKGYLYVLDTAGTLKSTTWLRDIPGMADGPCK